MKNLHLILFVLSPFLFAQKQIGLEEITEHIGKKIRICEKIYGSYVIGSNGMTLLNVGKPYPDNPLTLVVFEKDLKNFSYVPAEYLLEKSFCATGKLILYKDKPEIVLKSEKDIELISDEREATEEEAIEKSPSE